MLTLVKLFVLNALEKAGWSLTRTKSWKANLDRYSKIYSNEAISGKRFYNVGAGDFYHPYWTNLDFLSDWYADARKKKDIIGYDLMTCGPLPIDTGTAEVIYTSHTIEHVTEEAVQNLFNEVYRVLRKGGVFRITTGPDAVTDYAALMRRDEDWFYWDEWYTRVGTFEHIFYAPATSVSLEERWLRHVASPLAPNDKSPSEKKYSKHEIQKILKTRTMEEAVDFFCSQCSFNPERPGNHISWWSHEKINRFLKVAGFSDIVRSGYGQSSCAIMRDSDLFDSTHPQMSIYVEARR